MNAARSAKQRVVYHARGLSRIVGVTGVACFGYGLAVTVYTERRWRAANSRIFDPPNWHGFSVEDKEKVISKRERVVQNLKKIFELDEGTIEDPCIQNMFLKDCVLEDPRIRFVGKDEILRAHILMIEKIEHVRFLLFEPVHYKEKIVINSSREFALKDEPEFVKSGPKNILHSKFIIYLSEDDEKEEKICYIGDEWNSVSFLQPETHNAIMFAGSVAKTSRRLTAIWYFAKYRYSILNPFHIFEKAEKFLKKRYGEESAATRKTVSGLEEENVPLFNAGVTRTDE